MSRKRKFQAGDICIVSGEEMPQYAVIVDYRQDGTGRGEYRVQRVLHPLNGGAVGPAVWRGPHFLLKVADLPTRAANVRIYNANQKLEDRGCSCNCCPHEAIPRSMIRKDGTFRWDDE